MDHIPEKNIPVYINFFDRGVAEQNYSFRIYQGGVVPSNNVRIVNIGNLDIEACGGTHVFNTGEIGFIKILKRCHLTGNAFFAINLPLPL